MNNAESSPICKSVPSQLSSFIDTFVDFSISNTFPSPETPLHSNTQNTQTTPTPANTQTTLKTTYPPPDRLVAIGDLHGDLSKTKQAFRLANLIDGDDHWTGGSTMVVQVGDVLDRGGDELKILYFLEKLKSEAKKGGGEVVTMNGNHEVMNVDMDFRFVSKSGLNEFEEWARWYNAGVYMKRGCVGLAKERDVFEGIPMSFSNVRKEFWSGIRARIAALRVGGPVSRRFLADNVTVLVVGDSVFVHGGLLKEHVGYGLERINEEVRRWIKGDGVMGNPGLIRGRDSLVWSRRYSEENAKKCDCSALEHVLAMISGSKRMIMGHTIQEAGINGACENKAIRIDVGMSKGCGNGLPEVLEISKADGLRVFTSNPLFISKYYSPPVKFEEKKEVNGSFMKDHVPKQVKVNA